MRGEKYGYKDDEHCSLYHVDWTADSILCRRQRGSEISSELGAGDFPVWPLGVDSLHRLDLEYFYAGMLGHGADRGYQSGREAGSADRADSASEIR